MSHQVVNNGSPAEKGGQLLADTRQLSLSELAQIRVYTSATHLELPYKNVFANTYTHQHFMIIHAEYQI